MSGGKTISNIEPAAGNLRVQTAVYGAAIPLVYGRTRISGNLVWYGGFTAVPHTSTQSQGGKGGGGTTTENTSFTYTAAVIMVLCEGPINTVLTGWKSKQRFDGAAQDSGIATTRSRTATVPGTGIVSSGYPTTFLQPVSATDSRSEAWDPGSWST